MTLKAIKMTNSMIEDEIQAQLTDSGLNDLRRLCEKAPMSIRQMDDGPDALAERFFTYGEMRSKFHEAQREARELARIMAV
ncbi:hypothetical protein L6259_01275 [Candidatus Parcubacteria bacterium]|nr:hypothetical protein [Candidatus Parcubacteria bacterium]